MYKWLFCFLLAFCFTVATAQQPIDSIVVDSANADNIAVQTKPTPYDYEKLLADNIYLHFKKDAVAQVEKLHQNKGRDLLFYIVLGILVFFALLKYAFPKFFSTLFTVFFNTSMKQSQLTDQLQSNNLPAILYNILFSLSLGLLIFLYLSHYDRLHGSYGSGTYLFVIAGALGVLYLIKLFIIKTIGWLTGHKVVADTYSFIVFLINKILGVAILPLAVCIAFAPLAWREGFMFISLALVILSFLIRYIKSYSLIGRKLHWSIFHFGLFVFAIEALPLLIVYKAAYIYLQGNY